MLAEDMLFLTVADILSVFRIEKPVDESGNIVEPSTEVTSDLMRCVVLTELVYHADGRVR